MPDFLLCHLFPLSARIQPPFLMLVALTAQTTPRSPSDSPGPDVPPQLPRYLPDSRRIPPSVIPLRIVLDGVSGRLPVPKHIAPLLNRLLISCQTQRPIRRPIPDLHARPPSVVAWVHIAHCVALDLVAKGLAGSIT